MKIQTIQTVAASDLGIMCPKCGKHMKLKHVDESSNPRSGKKYDRMLYCCEADDVWLSLEIPQAEAGPKTQS